MLDPTPVLETPRLVLRKLTAADADDVFAYAREPEVARFTAWNPHQTLDDARDFIHLELARYERREPATWAIALPVTGRVIGCVGVVKHVPAHKKAEIGYVLAPSAQGQGYMTEAAGAVLAFLFGPLGCYRVEAFCKVENVASAAVMERLGMSFEGVLRAYVWKNGEPRDVKMYALLADEQDGALSPALAEGP